MHWKTLKIMTVVALLASPSALAAIPAQTTVDAAAGRTIAASDGMPMLQLVHHRGGRHDRFRGDRGGREFRGRHHDRGRHHYHRGRGHRHPHFRHHYHRPRHFHGRPIRRLFRHWLRHHY